MVAARRKRSGAPPHTLLTTDAGPGLAPSRRRRLGIAAAAAEHADGQQDEAHGEQADHAGQDDLRRPRRAGADLLELDGGDEDVLHAAADALDAHRALQLDLAFLAGGEPGVVPAQEGELVGGRQRRRRVLVEVVAVDAVAAVDGLVADPDVLRPGLPVVLRVGVVHVVGPDARVVTGVPPGGVEAAVGRHREHRAGTCRSCCSGRRRRCCGACSTWRRRRWSGRSRRRRTRSASAGWRHSQTMWRVPLGPPPGVQALRTFWACS